MSPSSEPLRSLNGVKLGAPFPHQGWREVTQAEVREAACEGVEVEFVQPPRGRCDLPANAREKTTDGGRH